LSDAAQLRFATFTDGVAMQKLARDCEFAPHWNEAAWHSVLQPSANRVNILAELEGRLAGFVVLQAIADSTEIESICVAAEVRRRGIARMLSERAIAWARTRGAVALQLEVRVSNAAAIALYRSLGFHEQGRRKSYYSQPNEDAVLMSMHLR
jgi:ribosomal-protein-alanine N-acetyltransferase